MLYLAFIFHMHQPYYKNILTQESELPWVRLHGVKDYLDMVQILDNYPAIHQTFNIVPSLFEQIEDYNNHAVKDKFLEFSYKKAEELSYQEKEFILQNFFSINPDKVVSVFPRYYELYFKKQGHCQFDTQDYLDLQVLFNLAWIDPSFREGFPELRNAVRKARYFTEDEKHAVLDKHLEILKDIIPGYNRSIKKGQIEVSVTPYYHPILPLLYSTNLAKEANPKTLLPRIEFSFPQDAKEQVESAVEFYKQRFGIMPCGMWPSEESVCEEILPFFMQCGIKWIVTDEAILFKSLRRKKRDTGLLYQPHLLKRKDGELNIIFRDRNLSDLIGFVYHKWDPNDAAKDFIKHLENTAKAFKDEDSLVTIAMDGENAWEYYANDGHDFLNALYQGLSESRNIKSVTVSEYLKEFPPQFNIKRLAAGSWIFGDFGKWIGMPQKVRAWEYLAKARKELEEVANSPFDKLGAGKDLSLAWKQMHILEGSDWFWWYGEDPGGSFDRLFRVHMSNFYNIIGKETPEYLQRPIE
ncbi:MAG: hypothetical protein KJ880_07450 [Candidatus Omnitrophica bacterium]|nr:hypothetical protein [Candidatus Omnitrophota bacterium]MBU1869406.1 hypothetical protein [Candidatus Omnitrophota bacterium]